MPGIPAPLPLYNQAQGSFLNAPYTGAPDAPGHAFSDIANLNINPAAQYGAFQGYNNQLGAQGNVVGSTYGPSWGSQAFTSGQPAMNAGQNIYNQTNPAAQGVLNNLFNNQSGLYNQLYNQNQQQANVQNAMSGVATTPYGAALAQQSGQNFNNAWQSFLNQQQNLGANTIGTLENTGINALLGGTSALQGGQNIGSNILGNLLGAGGNAISQGQTGNQAIDTQQFNAQQGQMQDFLNYAGASDANALDLISTLNSIFSGGVNAAAVNNQAQQAGQRLDLGSLSGLGSLAGSLGGLLLA